MMHGRMLCGSPIELAQKTSKKRMIDAAIAQTCCSRICIRSSGVEAHGRIQRGGTATADQVTDSGGSKECDQIKKYAYAVSDDERFSSLPATWNFWVISNELDKHVKRSANQDGRAKGIIDKTSDNGVSVTVWAKEWSQIIQENKHRLKFIQEKLEYSLDRQEGIKHLKEVYADFTKDVLVDNDEETEV